MTYRTATASAPLAIAVCLACALTACGIKGNPKPPPAEEEKPASTSQN